RLGPGAAPVHRLLKASAPGRPSQSGVTIEGQIVVDRANGGRAFADRSRDSFGRSGADVADGEQSGMAGFKRQRGASERFPGPVEVLAPEGSIRAHNSSIVESGEAEQPLRWRPGARDTA